MSQQQPPSTGGRPQEQQQQQQQQMYQMPMQPRGVPMGQGYPGQVPNRPMPDGSPAGGPAQPPSGYFAGQYGGGGYYYGGQFPPGVSHEGQMMQQPGPMAQPGTSPSASPNFGPASGVPMAYRNPANSQFYMYPVQNYYPPSGQAGMGGPRGAVAPPAPKPVVRERKPLVIIDPKTQKAVEIKAKAAPAKPKTTTVASEGPGAAATISAASTSAPAKSAAVAPTVNESSESKSQPNLMYAAVQAKLLKESGGVTTDSTSETAPGMAAPEDRQRKEAEAKARADEQVLLAEEKKKKLSEEQNAADRAQKEAESKRNLEELKKKAEDEVRRAEEEKVLKAADTMRAQAGGRSAFSGSAGGRDSNTNAGNLASRGTGTGGAAFRSGAFGGPPAAPVSAQQGSMADPGEAPSSGEKPSGNSDSNKITYSMASLLELKATNTEKPQDLESVNFEIVQVQSAPRQGTAFGGGQGGRGGFQGGNRGNNGPRSSGGRQAPNQRAPRGRNGGAPPQVGAHFVAEPIKRGEGAWVAGGRNVSDDEATIMKINGILNKLTLEKFDRLSKQLLDIPMTSYHMLNGTMAAVFDKALAEPKFGELYADLCRVIVDHKNKDQSWDFVKIIEKDGKFYWTKSADPEDLFEKPHDTEEEARVSANKHTDFKRILVNKCQEEFQKEDQILTAEEKVSTAKEELTALEAAKPIDEEAIAKLKRDLQDYNYEALKIKRKVLGNVQFIGELYKKKILTEKVMHNCIFKILFGQAPSAKPPPTDRIPSEEDLECLCKLLTTIGSTLDASTNASTRALVQTYFQQLTVLSTITSIDARHRFMISDLLELRANNWHARREELKAKKIQDVHKDAQREERQKSNHAPSNRGGTHAGNGLRSTNMANNNRGGNHNGARRGWDNNNSINAGGQRLSVAGGGQMAQGYRLGGQQTQQGANFPRTTGSTARQSAGGAAAAPRSNSSNVSMRPGGSNGTIGSGLGSSIARPVGGFGAQQNQQRTGGRGLNAKVGGSMRPSGGAGAGKPLPKAASAKPAMDPVKLANKIQFTFTEYVEMQNTEELIQSMQEIVSEAGEAAHSVIVNTACEMIVEKKDAERRYVPAALVELEKAKILSTEDFTSTLNDKLEFLGDEIIDNPLATKYYGSLFGTLIQEGSLPISALFTSTRKFVEESPHLLPKLIAAVFSFLKETPEGIKVVKDQADTFKIEQLIGENTAPEKFISDNDLASLF